MERRPIGECVAGIDDVMIQLEGQLEEADLVLLRFATASFMWRQMQVVDRLDEGEDPRWLVTDGVVAFWPEEVELGAAGIPVGGAELLPIAVAVLNEAGEDRAKLVEGAEKARAVLSEGDLVDDLPLMVAVEVLESLVFAALVADI